jgi:hypothetical protein
MIRIFNDSLYDVKEIVNRFLYSPKLAYSYAIFPPLELFTFLKGIIYFNPKASVDDIYDYSEMFIKYFYDGKPANRKINQLNEAQLAYYVKQVYDYKPVEHNKLLSESTLILNNKYTSSDWFEYIEGGFFAFDNIPKLLKKRINVNDMAYAINGLIYMNEGIGLNEIYDTFKLLKSSYNEDTLLKHIRHYLEHPSPDFGDFRTYKLPSGNFILFNEFKPQLSPNDLIELSKERVIKFLVDSTADAVVNIKMNKANAQKITYYDTLKKQDFQLKELLSTNKPYNIGDFKLEPVGININKKTNRLDITCNAVEYTVADKILLI